MYDREYTPEKITELKPNEIFVFGSNLDGFHGGGAARVAYNRFGAIWGQGVGLQGQSYAIPTMQGGVETIQPYVDEFVEYAKQHQEYKFLVTRIGCGIAGFRDEEIAPLLAEALGMKNIILPKQFVEVLSRLCREKQCSTTSRDSEKDDAMKALQMWKIGAGNSAKRFNGENPIPKKKTVATKDSWNIKPMPEKNVLIPMNVTIPREAMQVVKMGHIPDAMEDHWFMYCDESTIRYYRSWTGFCIYIAKYVEDSDKCTITELQVNRDPEQYGNTDISHDRSLFMALLTEEYGGDASSYWDKVL